MSDVLATSRSTWRRLGVSRAARADLETELRADLADAAADGVEATTFVGGSAETFAREWALARGLVRTRWRVLGCAVGAFAGGFPVLALFVWLFVGRGAFLPDPQRPTSWLVAALTVAPWLILPALAGVAFYLGVLRDPLRGATLVLTAMTSPLAWWAGLSILGAAGDPRSVWIRCVVMAAMLATTTLASRFLVVARDRRKVATAPGATAA